MLGLNGFLFFDLEYNPKTAKVREYGFILGDCRVRAVNSAKLESAVEKATPDMWERIKCDIGYGKGEFSYSLFTAKQFGMGYPAFFYLVDEALFCFFLSDYVFKKTFQANLQRAKVIKNFEFEECKCIFILTTFYRTSFSSL